MTEKIKINNVRVRFHLWRSSLIEASKVKIYGYKSSLRTFVWFQIRAWNALRGKEMIIDSRQVKSMGGYVYKQVEISKSPASKTKCI